MLHFATDELFLRRLHVGKDKR